MSGTKKKPPPEEQIEAYEKFLDHVESKIDFSSPLRQKIALKRLDRLQKSFEDGRKDALLTAIATCLESLLPIPDWAANGYLKAYRNVRQAKEGSWDDAFGRPYRKGVQLEQLRRRRALRSLIHWQALKRLNTENRPTIDDGFFEELGALFGVGKTFAKKSYYFQKNASGEVFKELRQETISRKMPRKSKTSRQYKPKK